MDDNSGCALPDEVECYPLVLHPHLVFPSVSFPLSIGYPAGVRAVEEALTSGGLIFLANLGRELTDDSPPEQILDAGIFNVGTLCRVLSPWLPIDCSRAPGHFLAVGVERALAVRFVEQDGIHSALARRPSLAPDSPGNAAQVASLVGSVCRLIDEIKMRDRRLNIFPGLGEGLLEFTDDDKSDPSHFADYAAFMLALHGQISIKDQRSLLATFSTQERLKRLVALLKYQLDERRLVEMIRRRAAVDFASDGRGYIELAALGFIAVQEGKNPGTVSALFERQIGSRDELEDALSDPEARRRIDSVLADPEARLEIARHLRYLFDLRMDEVTKDVSPRLNADITSMHIEAGVRVKDRLSFLTGERVRPEERRGALDMVQKLQRAHSAFRLGINPDGGRPKEWDGPGLLRAIQKSMEAVLRLPNGVGISYPTVADELNKLYPDRGEMTASKLQYHVGVHGINWKEMKKRAEREKNTTVRNP